MMYALHGFTGCAQNWHSLKSVDHALDILGHSTEAPAQGGESFSDEVQRLAALLPSRVQHLVGYSLGARLSLAIAIAYPDRIEKLTLIGVSPGLRTPQEREARVAQDQEWVTSLQESGIDDFVNYWQALPMWQSQDRLPRHVQAAQRKQRLAQDPTQLALSLAALGTGVMPPMWQDLAGLSMPIHLLVGEQDIKYRDIARSMLHQLPNARLSVIKECGHNLVLENPGALDQLLLTPANTARASNEQHCN